MHTFNPTALAVDKVVLVRTILRILLVLLLLLPFSSIIALTAAAFDPGDLDTNFDTDGKVTTNFGGNDIIQSVVIQPTGRIVVAGYSNAGGTYDFALARYIGTTATTPANLDGGFDTDGKVTTDFGGDDRAYSVANQTIAGLQYIVVAGYTTAANGDTDFAVARYNNNGTLDTTTDITPGTSFGTGGMVTTDFGVGSDDYGYTVAIQSDGKIVVAGSATAMTGGNRKFAVVRYNPDGSLDTSFGKSTYDFNTFPGATSVATSVAIQSDGKIVVAGYSNAGGTNDFVLMRLVGGNGPSPAPWEWDSSFHPFFGHVTTDFGGNDIAQSVAIQSDGQIVVAGSKISGFAGLGDFALARYNGGNGPSPVPGTLDTTFGSGGMVTTDFGIGSDDSGFSVAIQGDGKIVVAGYSTPNALGGGFNDFALARYHGLSSTGTPGTLDTTFGSGGMVTTDFGGSADAGFSMAIQPNGKIVVAGRRAEFGSSDFAVARYYPELYQPIVTTPVPGVGWPGLLALAFGLAVLGFIAAKRTARAHGAR